MNNKGTSLMAPFIHGSNSHHRIRRIRLLAILPVLIASIFNTGYQYLIAADNIDNGGTDDWRGRAVSRFVAEVSDIGLFDILVSGLIHVVPPLIVAIVTAGIWQRIFSEKRNRVMDTGFIYTSILFVCLMPPGVSLLHVVIGISFAVVLASAVFGGEGKSFLSPALVAAAMVQVSFPGQINDNPVWDGVNGYAGTTLIDVFHQQGQQGLDWYGVDIWSALIGTTQGLMGATSVIAVAVGGIILVSAGIASWRIIVGVIAGVICTASVFSVFGEGIFQMPWYWHISLGSLAMGAVFISTDPASSSATNYGRWIQGIITGALVVILRVAHPSHPDSVVLVLLLVSMLAPLIDHGVIFLNIRKRARGHG